MKGWLLRRSIRASRITKYIIALNLLLWCIQWRDKEFIIFSHQSIIPLLHQSSKRVDWAPSPGYITWKDGVGARCHINEFAPDKLEEQPWRDFSRCSISADCFGSVGLCSGLDMRGKLGQVGSGVAPVVCYHWCTAGHAGCPPAAHCRTLGGMTQSHPSGEDNHKMSNIQWESSSSYSLCLLHHINASLNNWWDIHE